MSKKDQQIISNAWICSIVKNEVNPIFGDLIIENGLITKIRQRNYEYFLEHPHKVNEESYNAGGKVITVPLVNFHDHFYSRLAKGFHVKGSTENFSEILHNYWWKVDKLLDDSMIRASARLAALESIKNGVLYIFDHHSSPLDSLGSLKLITDVLAEFNLRGTLCFETTDRNGAELAAKGLLENKETFERLSSDNFKSMLGLHASFTLSDDTLADASELINRYELGIHIHLSEDELDNKVSLEVAGKRPVERLEEFNLLNIKSILAHGIHLNVSDYEILHKNGSALALNLDSNYNNSVGLPLVSSIPEYVPILFGTDGMNANPAKSLKQYFLLMRHQKASFEEAFHRLKKAYFDQLVFIKRYFSDYSFLNKGDKAEFIMWDYLPPAPLNGLNFFSHYIYGIVESRVRGCFRDDKFLMKDFILNDIDELGISAEIAVQGKKLKTLFEDE